ncbi:hypothetical protein [Actinophytocola sp. NPDC049390]|uniref:hypothetical protein n=1 Tax=Actinophytocola sp. NPDC049390 TaxID=3363894 RepID=UPI00378837C5
MYEAIGGAVSAFSNAAASGQVTIEAEAAADALAKLGKVKDQLTELLQSDHGKTDVQLGANPVGQAMSRKSVGRYDGDDSFIAALRILLSQTEKAETALNQCIRNYVDTDDFQAATYNRTN